MTTLVFPERHEIKEESDASWVVFEFLMCNHGQVSLSTPQDRKAVEQLFLWEYGNRFYVHKRFFAVDWKAIVQRIAQKDRVMCELRQRSNAIKEEAEWRAVNRCNYFSLLEMLGCIMFPIYSKV